MTGTWPKIDLLYHASAIGHHRFAEAQAQQMFDSFREWPDPIYLACRVADDHLPQPDGEPAPTQRNTYANCLFMYLGLHQTNAPSSIDDKFDSCLKNGDNVAVSKTARERLMSNSIESSVGHTS